MLRDFRAAQSNRADPPTAGTEMGPIAPPGLVSPLWSRMEVGLPAGGGSPPEPRGSPQASSLPWRYCSTSGRGRSHLDPSGQASELSASPQIHPCDPGKSLQESSRQIHGATQPAPSPHPPLPLSLGSFPGANTRLQRTPHPFGPCGFRPQEYSKGNAALCRQPPP